MRVCRPSLIVYLAAELRKAVEPVDLEEVLTDLQKAGFIESFHFKGPEILIWKTESRRVETLFFSESVSEPIINKLMDRKKRQ